MRTSGYGGAPADAKPSLSPQTLEAVVDLVTGGSHSDTAPPVGVYRSAGQLERLFGRCNLAFTVGSASRVPSVRAFMMEVSLRDDGFEMLCKVIEAAVEPRDFVGDEEKQARAVGYINDYLRSDGIELLKRGNRYQLARAGGFAPVADALVEKVVVIDFDTVERDVRRALKQAEEDPEDAVTAACSLLESVCRSILIEMDEPLPDKKDMATLMDTVQAKLHLSPGRKDLPQEIEADVKRILGGLNSTARGIGALRTHAGDAHGRERGYARIDRRIACLAIHAASTLALFLLETWQRDKTQKRACATVVTK
ncbi:abortive infection family protein [Azospirillum cavernae]|nr:abortive infection family protein [Azospirillum cavernae]